MMTSAEIRQSFLDFFKSKQHTIVPSSSLLPDAPNLLFTNAGMNQFVPIFLGQAKPQWNPARAADTQKCIRAGGKHNDLEDVGLDTYHHTFFEMLGNWSFGDYFKSEAIDWAWELLVNVWKFPKERLYATYFGGDDKTPEDKEAKEHWLRYLPADHVLPGDRKDNFWMMGDTGPCGPCSEIHVDLRPNIGGLVEQASVPVGNGAQAETPVPLGSSLVNAGTPQCIEIWNLVFIQFNANADPDNSLSELPAKHVDTGMGFERVCGIIQCTDGFKDFTRTISNYESDVFTPIFRELEKLSGKKHTSTLPRDSSAGVSPVFDREGMNDTAGTAALLDQIKTDIAFRVIADHIRCLSFAIADGILPSNEGRGYVLRRILRRAVRYGRNLDFHEPFFYKLADVVADNFGDVFPEVRRNKAKIQQTIKAEEESFNRTLDRGIDQFGAIIDLHHDLRDLKLEKVFPGDKAFELYDTYGFPLDLTELMAREHGLTVDVAGFEKSMEEQRRRAREDYGKKKTAIKVVVENQNLSPTIFLGYDNLEAETVVQIVMVGDKPSEFDVVIDRTPFYAEMGGQIGDTGVIHVPGHDRTEIGKLQVLDTQKQGKVHVHRAKLVSGRAPEVGEAVRVAVDAARRANIQRHHTATHLFHLALQEVVSRDARQRGSLVAPDHFRFDFNHPERLTEQQIADIERLVNERIKENALVSWIEVPYAEIKKHPQIRQFFGEKYGDVVRVLQVGGHPGKLDGFSMELCGGTHVRNTGDIGLFKIARESAIAAGVRRVEAVCGQFALEYIEKTRSRQQAEAEKEKARERQKEEDRRQKSEARSRATEIAERLLAETQRHGDINLVVGNLGEANAELLRAVVDVLKSKLQSGVVVLGGVESQAGTPAPPGKVSLICHVTPDLVKQGKHAGKIVGELAKLCGGGGGGRPDLAQAGGKQPEKLAEALAAVPRIAGV
ncbi:MAG: alanine--tRNA ligase [Verrucomicrobiia bacterium]|jgi:alanyl-tRNA synthetase